MRKLTVLIHPVNVKISGGQGYADEKKAIILEVIEGVSNLFLLDIKLWLNDLNKESWGNLPVFVMYHGGEQFPPKYSFYVKGYMREVHLLNVDKAKW